MNRSCYNDDPEMTWDWIRWRGAVNSSIRGRRGQAFLRELLQTLDAMPEKKLVKNALQTPQGDVCAIGSVMVKRGIDPQTFDPEDYETISQACGIAPALVREIEYINDEAGWGATDGDEDTRRYWAVRNWIASRLQDQKAAKE